MGAVAGNEPRRAVGFLASILVTKAGADEAVLLRHPGELDLPLDRDSHTQQMRGEEALSLALWQRHDRVAGVEIV